MNGNSNPSAGIGGFALLPCDPMCQHARNGNLSFGFRVVGVKGIRPLMDFGMIYKTYWIKLGVVVESLLLFTTMARDNTHHAGSRKPVQGPREASGAFPANL
jgi:hypothetical protein